MTKNKPTYEELENQIRYLRKEHKEARFNMVDFNSEVDFHDLFDVNEIQKIQDLFAEATGVASIITYPNGVPITKPSNFCRLCIDIIRKTEKGLKNCYHSDAVIGKHNIGGAIYQPCLSGGLWDGGASISVGSKHIANWLIGQVKNEAMDENRILLYAKEIGADEKEFKKALDEVMVMSIEKFKKITDTLFFFANEISQKAYQNILQSRLIAELQKKEEQLIKAKEKAEESDRLKTAFLQNMSHEIRTPMNAIMGFSDLLMENYENKQKLEYFSNIIYQRSSDLLDIINDILDISKIESGQNTVNTANFNLNELFNELDRFFEEYKARINKQNINVFFHPAFENSVFIVKTDKLKLKQIIINLVGNALKFTENGSVSCGYEEEDSKIKFYVADTGIGIPPDKHDFIFERFSQLKHPTVQNIGGTGLGLPIVKGLVKLLGGDVWLKSECNKGTTFYFSIDRFKK
jgi:signal transduction histidine kinase